MLVTGFDIIFFWVARMMMMGSHFMGDVPFRTVYIHALVRDERGQKMSKSKGNIIDPLELIDRYGADALRFTLAALAAQGRDIKLAESRVEGYRNFVTKLWNAARSAEMNGCALVAGLRSGAAQAHRQPLDRRRARAIRPRASPRRSTSYKFNDAADALYHFTWDTFCDWYLEFTKPILAGGDASGEGRDARDDRLGARARSCHLLHPIMPFITEALWRHLAGEEGGMLIAAPWPAYAAALARSRCRGRDGMGGRARSRRSARRAPR